MNTRKVDKREQHVRKKLTAAILMLLISCIMTVTSTYAWFTLSTAPEISGVSATVGGNGNLEIALASTESWSNTSLIATGTGQSNNNLAWGNLIDLSDNNQYGLDKVVLNPAVLNVSSSGTLLSRTNVLKTPVYTPDGRVSEVIANTTSGIYETEPTAKDYKEFSNAGAEGIDLAGVRAIGTISGKSERELAYEAAKTTIKSNTSNATNVIKMSWGNKGGVLASLAIKYAGANDPSEIQITATEITNLKELVADLRSAINYIDVALVAAIDGYLASNSTDWSAIGGDDVYIQAHKTLMGKSINDIIVDGKITIGENSFDVPSGFEDQIDAFNNMLEKVEESEDLALLIPENASWNDIAPVFTGLVNKDKITINGFGLDEAMDNIVTIMQNLQIELNEDSGIYYDIAEFTGLYSAKVTIPQGTTFKGVQLGGVSPSIIANYTGTSMLSVLSTGITAAGKPTGGNASTAITDTYGYAIDFFLRTNASGSKLLLSDAVNRIYEGNTNEETMGGGSSFKFTSFDSTFPDDGVIGLMKAIRVVFVDATDTIIAEARLDESTYVKTDEYYMELKIWETVKDADGNTISSGFKQGEQSIMDMPQNTIVKLTAIVYLDGESIDNSSVATTANSVTGQLNLQFASSAELIPMDYTDLKQSSDNISDNTESNSTLVVTSDKVSYDASTKTLSVETVDNAEEYFYSLDNQAWNPMTNGVIQLTEGLSDEDVVYIKVSAENYTDGTCTFTYTAN